MACSKIPHLRLPKATACCGCRAPLPSPSPSAPTFSSSSPIPVLHLLVLEVLRDLRKNYAHVGSVWSSHEAFHQRLVDGLGREVNGLNKKHATPNRGQHLMRRTHGRVTKLLWQFGHQPSAGDPLVRPSSVSGVRRSGQPSNLVGGCPYVRPSGRYCLGPELPGGSCR